MIRPLLMALCVLAVAAACNADQEAVADPPEATTAEGFPTVTLETTTGFTDTERATAPTTVTEDCSTRSEAEFGGAFDDPRNLVVGPLVLVGAGEAQPASVVESHGGQKFPLLVRAGHSVLVEVPAEAHELVALGYGPLPQGEVEFEDGHPAVRFEACAAGGASSSTAGPGKPVTFWSGFVLASEPTCAPLDVFVDNLAARRVEIALGADC
jgi:hypothetical protein